MKLNNSILFVMFLILTNYATYAQPRSSIIGKVIDKQTKEGLPFVNIILVNTTIGAATDINGSYKIENVPIGTYKIKFSAVGYESVIKTDIIVSSGRPAMVDVELMPAIIKLQDAVVQAEYFSKIPSEMVSVRGFSQEEIRRAPGGFEDVVRALSVLPGIAFADPGRNDLIVRGGAPSENLFIVDGFVVQNINHFGAQGATGGPLSYINLDFVSNTSFSTGGFSAQYGDKLSSVLSINLREGRKDKIGGKATLSATQFGLNLEGPIATDQTFIFSVRRSYLDLIFRAAGFSFVPEYYDALAKYNYDIDKKNKLSFLYIGAFDNVKFFNDTPEKRLDNTRAFASDQIQYVTGFSYRHIHSYGFFDITLGRNFVDYDTYQRDSALNYIFKNLSREGENFIEADFNFITPRKSELTLGFIAKHIRFKSDLRFPTFRTTFGEILSITNANVYENYYKLGAYAQFNHVVLERVRINAGLRADYFNAIKDNFVFATRLGLSLMLTPITNFNVSLGRYYQSPSYIWLTAYEQNKNLKFIQADQYIAGFDHLLREDIQAKIEIYYKNYSKYPTSLIRPYLTLANTGAGFAGAEDNFSSFGLEPLASLGKGFSRGIEFSMQKKSSEIPHYGIMSVTYGQTKFKGLDGILRNGAYDQTWLISLSAGYIFNPKYEASLKFRFATGKPYTPFNSDGTQSVQNYLAKRLPEQHSLDLRVDRRFNFDKWNLIAYIDVQNIYNRKNVSFVRWDRKTNSVEKSAAIGVLPSIGISAEF
jgi:hypothetical protein